MVKPITLDPEKLELLLTRSPAALCFVDFDGRIKQANPATASMLGRSMGQLQGLSVFEIVHPDDRDPLISEFESLARGEPASSFESRFRRSDGEYVWLLWNATSLPEENCIFGVAQDVTERKAQEKQRYRRVFEAAQDGIVILDFDSGRILQANKRAAELFGYTQERLAGVSLWDVEPLRRNNLAHDIVNQLRGQDSVRREETLITPDGSTRICELLCNRYMEGEVALIQCNVRDISSRRATERELTRSEEHFRVLVEGVRDYAIFMMDPDGIVISWNTGAERIIGYEAAEILGRSAQVLFTPEDIRMKEAEHELERAKLDGRAEDERWHVRKDGSRFFASGVVTALWENNGRLRGFAKVMRDITARRNNEEAMREAQKLESIGLLAGGVAHDFNNLLTGIIGNASFVLEDLGTLHPASRNIEGILASGRRAADLTRQLLAYSGKARFIVEAVDISAKVSEILDLIHASIPERIKLELRLAPSLPAVEADPSQIQQVAMNLIINASEAIPGEGEILITTRHRHFSAAELSGPEGLQNLTPGDYVVLEVQDNGEGMDEETRAKIFDPFFTTKFTGRGLGLAAVSGIIRGHRGAIQVISARHQGSTFRVVLPAVEVAPTSRTRNQTSMAAKAGSGLILLVDDDELVLRIAKEALERRGFQVVTAKNGKEAVEVFESRADEVDLVILDMAMPVMSGEEAYRHLKALRPKIPVLVTTGYSELLATERFGPAIVKAFIQKPFTGRELSEKVQSVLNAESDS